MTISIGELRKFQDTWGPVIATIPAVINMVEMEADLNRALVTKRQEFEAAEKSIASAFEEADKLLEKINQELEAVSKEKQALREEIDASRTKFAEQARQIEVDRDASLSGIQAAIADAQGKATQAIQEAEASVAKAQADAAVQKAEMEAEIKDLEKRRAAAEKALDTLRAKLG
jgi:chromosome segregation ATPase